MSHVVNTNTHKIKIMNKNAGSRTFVYAFSSPFLRCCLRFTCNSFLFRTYFFVIYVVRWQWIICSLHVCHRFPIDLSFSCILSHCLASGTQIDRMAKPFFSHRHICIVYKLCLLFNRCVSIFFSLSNSTRKEKKTSQLKLIGHMFSWMEHIRRAEIIMWCHA